MKKSISRQTISLFWYHATRYKRFLIPLFFVIPVTVLISDFLQPYIISEVLQKISQKQYSTESLWAEFSTLIIGYTVATIISGIIGWRITIWLIWHLELRVVRDLSRRIFNHVMGLSADFHANHFGGSLVSQSNKLTGSYIRFMDATVFNLYTLIISIIATIVILAPRVPVYAVTLVGLSILYIIGAVLFSRKVLRANQNESAAQSQQTGNLADSITNVMAIKSFAAEEEESNRYWKAASHTRNMGLRSLRATTIRETYASTVTSTISIASIIIAVVGVGVFNVNIATLFLIVSYTAVIGHRLWEFQSVLRQYNRALGDAQDMVKILNLEPAIKDPEQPQTSRITSGSISLNDVVFAHSGSKSPLFNMLNLHVKPGEKVGLVGHSGSGKSTLTKLLLRFSDVDSGSITIDGQDIRNIKQSELRKHIAYVPQDPLLFHRSLAENIAYGRPRATLKEIRAIAKLAHADEFIQQLSETYQTTVGERGVKLSGGQRQRVAIARAMLKDAPILILDEATSALDSESEVLIQDALWKLMEGRTALVIAHRLSTIQKMDRIIVLENGMIIEQGTHKELLRAKGVYAGLWAHQSGGFLED